MPENTQKIYMHGTNSSVLAFLPLTNFRLISPIDLIEKHQRAPMSGEISKGGLALPKSRCNPCFVGGEDIVKVFTYAKGYSDMYIDIPYPSKIGQDLQLSFQYNLSSINQEIVQITRARQHGFCNIAGMPEIKQLDTELHNLKQLVYALLLICKFGIAIDGRNFISSENNVVFDRNVIEQLLNTSGIDFEAAWNNPTQEVLDKISNIFTYQSSEFFSLNLNNNVQPGPMQESPESIVYSFFRSPKTNSFAFTLLIKALYYNAPELADVQKHLLEYISDLNNRYELLKKILSLPDNHFELSKSEKLLISKNFPIILICEDPSIFERKNREEFRATCELEFGKHIKIIATDTTENQQTLRDWLKANNLKNVDVKTFAELDNGIPKNNPNNASFKFISDFVNILWEYMVIPAINFKTLCLNFVYSSYHRIFSGKREITQSKPAPAKEVRVENPTSQLYENLSKSPTMLNAKNLADSKVTAISALPKDTATSIPSSSTSPAQARLSA